MLPRLLGAARSSSCTPGSADSRPEIESPGTCVLPNDRRLLRFVGERLHRARARDWSPHRRPGGRLLRAPRCSRPHRSRTAPARAEARRRRPPLIAAIDGGTPLDDLATRCHRRVRRKPRLPTLVPRSGRRPSNHSTKARGRRDLLRGRGRVVLRRAAPSARVGRGRRSAPPSRRCRPRDRTTRRTSQHLAGISRGGTRQAPRRDRCACRDVEGTHDPDVRVTRR